jgi:hypothetical protein
VYQVLGWTMVLGCLPFMAVVSTYNQLLMALGGMVLFVGGGVLLRRGLKHSAQAGDEILHQDDRLPIVYFRSFADEADDYHLWTFLRGAFGVRISQDVPAWASQEQWLLGKYLSKIGPYVAIGRPGEPFPELGAARIYIGEEWEQKVTDLLRCAKLIILRAGSTEGFRWELSQILENVRPAKVLLILPGSRRAYERFRAWAPPPFARLPESRPIPRLVSFDDDWTPRLLSDRKSLDETLRPFLERNGIDAPKHSAIWKARL